MRAISTTIILIAVLLGVSTANAVGPAQRPGAPVRPITTTGNTLPGDDILALAVLVIMDASKSAQEDLKSIMASVKAINANKQQLRQQVEKMQQIPGGPCNGAIKLRDCIQRTRTALTKIELASLDLMRASGSAALAQLTSMADGLRHAPEESERVRNNLPPPARIMPANPCKGWNAGFWRRCVLAIKIEVADNLFDSAGERGILLELDALERDIASLGDLSELNQLRLQKAMDRLSKAAAMISNIMKKIADTQSTITQNLK